MACEKLVLPKDRLSNDEAIETQRVVAPDTFFTPVSGSLYAYNALRRRGMSRSPANGREQKWKETRREGDYGMTLT
ncbi:hypothetical protein KM043_006519 [Ampulex compressa]|nr:hypothetical protein KM043_006519 [Ampulex compressa]